MKINEGLIIRTQAAWLSFLEQRRSEGRVPEFFWDGNISCAYEDQIRDHQFPVIVTWISWYNQATDRMHFNIDWHTIEDLWDALDDLVNLPESK